MRATRAAFRQLLNKTTHTMPGPHGCFKGPRTVKYGNWLYKHWRSKFNSKYEAWAAGRWP